MKRPVPSALATLIVATLACSLGSAPARSQQIILESATLGATGQTGGDAIALSQFVGWRFDISSPMIVDRVGGNMGGIGAGGIFAALLALPSIDALPTGAPFAPGELLVSTTFQPPTFSADVRTPLSATLTPGSYALLFGTGLFGATGDGFIVNGSSQQDIPPTNQSSYIFWSDVGPIGAPTFAWRAGLDARIRFVVEGHAVPEPTSHAILGLGATVTAFLRRRFVAYS